MNIELWKEQEKKKEEWESEMEEQYIEKCCD